MTHKHTQIKTQEHPQKGRSMVEMLGVLAIIGVLSIGGIAGYTQAMNRHKANEILDTATKLCIISKTKASSISGGWWNKVESSETNFSDLDIQGPVAGCATNIATRFTLSDFEDCAVKITGCQDETAVINFLNTLREPLLSDLASVIQTSDGLAFCLRSNTRHDSVSCNGIFYKE